jgi:hypothetical protein
MSPAGRRCGVTDSQSRQCFHFDVLWNVTRVDHRKGPKLAAFCPRNARKAAVVETSGRWRRFHTQMSPLVALPPRPSTDQFYPILYGTGIRSAGNSVFVAIQGLKARSAAATRRGQLRGSTRLNVLASSGLAGNGTVRIALTAGGIYR